MRSASLPAGRDMPAGELVACDRALLRSHGITHIVNAAGLSLPSWHLSPERDGDGDQDALAAPEPEAEAEAAQFSYLTL